MDMRWYFTQFLLAFCVVHLADVVQRYCAAKLAARRERAARRSPSASPSLRPVLAAAFEHDWYVYFKRSDLTGPAKNNARRQPPADADAARERGRPARRPDLRPAAMAVRFVWT